MSDNWNPTAFAHENKQSTNPVSAFFLIDSTKAMEDCVYELGKLLSPYHVDPNSLIPYIETVLDHYANKRTILNFDADLTLTWKDRQLKMLVRCHSINAQQYEMELWLPGIIAADIQTRGLLSDGRRGFFCAFMPPSFYD